MVLQPLFEDFKFSIQVRLIVDDRQNSRDFGRPDLDLSMIDPVQQGAKANIIGVLAEYFFTHFLGVMQLPFLHEFFGLVVLPQEEIVGRSHLRIDFCVPWIGMLVEIGQPHQFFRVAEGGADISGLKGFDGLLEDGFFLMLAILKQASPLCDLF